MKVMFDSNIYISWIREKRYPELMLDIRKIRYLSSVVLMELWAGARTRKASRIVDKLQSPYMKAERLITPKTRDYINAGQIISDLPKTFASKIQQASFLNDVFIALTAKSIGATLYTQNKNDFEVIKSHSKGLKIVYL